jgi:protoporphyrinogen oxidase
MTDVTAHFAVLGAGIAGLATSFHLDHRDAVVFESSSSYGGHARSEHRDGFTWDDGPHISFTANEYVRELFANSVGGAYEECPISPSNYFRGHWIDHPAQTHLYQVPEPLRRECLESFLATRDLDGAPANYREWLHQSMGPVFAETFPAAYTRKYWTTDPSNLDIDWIGTRVLKPEVDDVVRGAEGPLPRPTYYVATRDARYPSRGGFMGYTHKLAEGADIRYGKRMERIELARRRMWFTDGSAASYEGLVSTIPLPALVAAATDAPAEVRDAAALLRCTNFLRVDVTASHPTRRDELWMYVYDEDKLSVRISITENFSPNNAPRGRTGIQVEVYGSEYRPVPQDHDEVRRRVIAELVEMRLVDAEESVGTSRVTFVPQGNPIFDLRRRDAMRVIGDYLDRVGVQLAGRYAEWKYLMTDACVISGRRAASRLTGAGDDVDDVGTSISSQG